MSEYFQTASPAPEPPPSTPIYKRAWFAAAVAGVVGIVIGSVAAGGGDADDDAEAAPATTVTVTVAAEERPPVDEPADEPTSEVPSAEPTSEEPPAGSANPVFGDTFTYDDGLSITVSAPTPFEPSEFAIVDGAAAYVSFDVTVVNATAENFDPTLFTTTAQSAGSEASEVFDSENGFTGSPSTTVLPGRQVTFKIGYGVSDPADVVLEVSPDFERDDVIYTS